MSKNRTVSLVPTVTLTYNKDDLGFDFLNRKICLKTNSQRIVIHITLAEYLELQKWYQKKKKMIVPWITDYRFLSKN